MTSGAGRNVTWTSFGKVASMTRGTTSLAWAYDADHQRSKQVSTVGSTTNTTWYYDDAASGASFERVEGPTLATWNDYLFAGGQRIGVRIARSDATTSTRYFVTNHLGSVAVITNETGVVAERLAYDAWGKRRNPDGSDDTANILTASATTRGFTDHEMIDEMDLVNMNGRVYDPIIGRFMSADPFIHDVTNSQDLNRSATMWVLHWRLAGLASPDFDKRRSTTWFWAFNHFSASAFTRDSMLSELEALGRDQVWTLKSSATLRRDIDCFVRCYAASRNARGEMIEDTLECPLSELSLIRPAPGGRAFEFVQGDKPNLPDSVFAFAVAEYVACLKSGAAVSLDALTYDVGSPGRVFRLGENGVADRLSRIEEASLGLFAWVDTAGVRQIQQTDQKVSPIGILKQAYRDCGASRRAA